MKNKPLPLIITMSLFAFSCAKPQPAELDTQQQSISYANTSKAFPSVNSLSQNGFVSDRVFFNFNNATVQGRYSKDLQVQAEFLKAELAKNPKLQVIIEGNCDERGGIEYNIALGQKRADSAKQTLVKYGVPSSAIKTVSFGKERKLVQGTSAVAYLQNRTAITKI